MKSRKIKRGFTPLLPAHVHTSQNLLCIGSTAHGPSVHTSRVRLTPRPVCGVCTSSPSIVCEGICPVMGWHPVCCLGEAPGLLQLSCLGGEESVFLIPPTFLSVNFNLTGMLLIIVLALNSAYSLNSLNRSECEVPYRHRRQYTVVFWPSFL